MALYGLQDAMPLPAAVEEAWSRRVPRHDLGVVSTLLWLVVDGIYMWKNVHFKSVPREIEKKREDIERLRQLKDEESVAKEIGLAKKMDELLYCEEIMWM
jgi:hypothetical protein